MKIKLTIATLSIACACSSMPGASFAAGGPLGIDSRLDLDEHGIWTRNNQRTLKYLTVGAVFTGALIKGSDPRTGRTFWQSTDSLLLGQAGYLVLSNALRRQRPSTTNSPNQWFKSGGHSFPSGEVTAISSAITPFVLKYGAKYHSVYALKLLPHYDSAARMKSQG